MNTVIKYQTQSASGFKIVTAGSMRNENLNSSSILEDFRQHDFFPVPLTVDVLLGRLHRPESPFFYHCPSIFFVTDILNTFYRCRTFTFIIRIMLYSVKNTIIQNLFKYYIGVYVNTRITLIKFLFIFISFVLSFFTQRLVSFFFFHTKTFERRKKIEFHLTFFFS